MNISFLETFYWLGTLKSVKETATRMRVSQPVVSMRMAAFQRALGVELYRTNGRKIELTAAGQRVLRKCEAIVPLATQMQEEIRKNDAESRTVRVGAAEVVGMSWLPEMLKHQRDNHPEISLSISTDTLTGLAEALRKDEIDLAFVIGPNEDPTLTSEYLCRYAIKWLGPPVLFDDGMPKTVVDLARFAIIQSRQSSYRHQKIMEYFRWHNVSRLEGLSPNHWVDIGFGITTCAHFASSGLGITAVPAATVEDWVHSGDLVELPIKEEIPPWEIIALYHRHHDTEMVGKVMDSARAAVAHYAKSANPRYFAEFS